MKNSSESKKPSQSKKHSILIIDDTPSEIQLLIENLKHEYATQVATSGARALALLDAGYSPDVILLDVMLPDIMGYDVCHRINQHREGNNKIDVIFVSAHDTVEEKMAGYEAGGSDYLIKPIEPDELMQKVKLALANRDLRMRLQEEMESVVLTAMTALSASTEQEVLADFYRDCLAELSVEALANLIVRALSRFLVSASVQLRSAQGTVELGEGAAGMRPLESELINQLKDKGTLLEPNNRLLVSCGPVSILVRNLPEETEKKTRIKNNITLIAEAAARKLANMDAHAELASGPELLKPYVCGQKAVLDDILIRQQQQKSTVMRVVDTLAQRFESEFLALGFSENQETALLEILHECTDALLSNYEQGVQLDDQLAQIFADLKRYAGA